MKPAFRFLCILAGTLCLGTSALASPTDLTDIPLRTTNRAKPNILFFIDNGLQTQWTYSPDAFPNVFKKLVTVQVAAKSKYDLSGSVEYSSQFYTLLNNTTSSTSPQNSNARADTDWHYRASGKYAAGGSCASVTPNVCTLNGKNADQSATLACPATPCTDAFNQLYFDPTYTYVQPKDASGTFMHLPQTVYATPAAAQAANCQCTDLVKCAWLDGFEANQNNYVFSSTAPGCVDLTSNFSTAPYPYLPGQLLPWSTIGTYPSAANNGYLPILAPVATPVTGTTSDGTITKFLVDSFNISKNPDSTIHAPVLPPGSVVLTVGTVTPTATVYAPGASGQPVGPPAAPAWASSWYSYYQAASFTLDYTCHMGTDCPLHPGTAENYYPPTCEVVGTKTVTATCSNPAKTADDCPPGQTVTVSGTFSNFWCKLTKSGVPSQLSSPVYCDTASQWSNYPSSSSDGLNPYSEAQACQSKDIASAPVYANPGPADFFDPDGTRHVITKTSDKSYFYSSTTDETKNNFAIWHSFYRTRLLSLKTSLSQAIGSNLDSNFRVGLAAVANSTQTTALRTFGACSDGTNNAACQFFSPVADFSDGIAGTVNGSAATWNHRTEWYGRLNMLTMAPRVVAHDYMGYLNTLYRWFAGVQPDPDTAGYWPDASPHASYPTQSMANANFNTGADSQYACNVDPATGNPILNIDGITCATPTGRSGPMMYSCQPNTLVFVAANVPSGISRTTGVVPPPNLATSTGGCLAPSYTTAYSGTSICDFDTTSVPSSTDWPPSVAAPAYALPGYSLLTPFCDALLNGISGTTACSGGSGNTAYAGGKITAGAAFPFPLKGESSSYYSDANSAFYGSASYPLSSLADLSLYYWSHDLNQEFNNQNTGGGVVYVTKPDGSGRLGVQTTPTDKAPWPHVTTYFVNLALASQCTYSTYPYPMGSTNCIKLTTATTYPTTWPTPSLNTKTDTDGSQYNNAVDDMAHAAFNGHGKYLSASGTAALQTDVFPGLFTSIRSLIGSESAVAVANTQVKASGVANYAFQSFYNSNGWWGDLRASPIDSSTGTILYGVDDVTVANCPHRQSLTQGYVCWSALQQLRTSLCPSCVSTNAWDSTATAAANTRLIISDTGASSSPGVAFTKTTLLAAQQTALQSYYLTGTTKTYRNDAINLVAYLRGDNTNESCVRGAASCTASGAAACYRCRYIPSTPDNTTLRLSTWYPMGDVVDAEAVAVAAPAFQYGGTYDAFKTGDAASRNAVIYQGGNDGMLHAFKIGSNGDAAGGNELWAYVPSFVIPNLQAIANPCHTLNPDSSSCSGHKYFVNATPTFGDIDINVNAGTTSATDGSSWRTLLAGGLGKGGRGYYALDVTAGDSVLNLTSKVKWIFPNADTPNATKVNLGYTYGRPSIVKVKDGTGLPLWAVLVSSGYNNGTATLADGSDGSGGDGKGHLYVLDAWSGSLLADLVTPCDSNADHIGNVCSASNPSGFAYFSANVTDPTTTPTVQAVYGGDLLGNVWKFDLSGNLGSWTVTRLASLYDSTGALQPVTSEPELAKPDGTNLMVYIGTGKYLGSSDIPNSQVLVGRQTVYALKADTTYTAGNGPRSSIDATRRINATDPTVFGPSYCTVPSVTNRCLRPGATQAATINDWLFDLPLGERIITNPQIVLGNLIFTSSVPLSDPCQPGGKSYFYMLDYRTGGMVPGATSVSQALVDPLTGESIMASRPTVIQLPDGRISILGSSAVGTTLQQANSGSNVTRRISWREVPNL